MENEVLTSLGDHYVEDFNSGRFQLVFPRRYSSHIQLSLYLLLDYTRLKLLKSSATISCFFRHLAGAVLPLSTQYTRMYPSFNYSILLAVPLGIYPDFGPPLPMLCSSDYPLSSPPV